MFLTVLAECMGDDEERPFSWWWSPRREFCSGWGGWGAPSPAVVGALALLAYPTAVLLVGLVLHRRRRVWLGWTAAALLLTPLLPPLYVSVLPYYELDSYPVLHDPLLRRARGPISHAQALDHGWLGDEHLLLALLDGDCPGAAPAARDSFGLTLGAVRAATAEAVGEPCPTAYHGILVSHRTQYVGERANLKAIELRDEAVASEHVLFALLETPDESRSRSLLSGAGVDQHALRRALIALTDRSTPDRATADGRPPLRTEAHAAEAARILGLSRRRVAELAASASDFPASRLDSDGHRVWPRRQIEAWPAGHPERGAPLRRLEPPAVGVVAPGAAPFVRLARAEAEQLNHRSVHSEHFLLALLRRDCPGRARAALESLGLGLEDARRRLVESMGDPFEPQELEPAIPMATKLLLERALLSAIELEDEELAGEHVLVALTEESDSFAWQLGEGELDPSAVRDALVAVTDGMLPVSKPPPPPTPPREAKRIPRPPEPELAPSPAGHDPRRRRPWGSAVFEIPGSPWSPANGQYYIDRDGHPVLTTDGRPVHSLTDEARGDVLDTEGKGGILVPVEVPAGSRVRSCPRE